MPNILIVDDDALTTKLYREFLERAQFTVHMAPDGVAAMQWLETNQADALVVDMLMPNMNGIEFMKRVRATERYKQTPIIAYTTAFVPTLAQQAAEAGASEVFDKSQLSGALLRNALNKHLGIS